jgi:transcriptional regulator with XRE-family HTH domain
MATHTDNEARHYLREWRVHLGLSQEQLARRLGTSKGVISRYESGARGMTVEVQFRLARALKIWVGQLFLPPEKPSIDGMLEDVSLEERRRTVEIVKLTARGRG